MSFLLLGILNSQAAAGGGAGAYDLLETQVLTSTAASVTFTGLGSYTDYKHLQIRAVARSTQTVGAFQLVKAQFNSDTGANYAAHYLNGNGSTVNSYDYTSQSYAWAARVPCDGGYSAADDFGSFVMDILDFNNTSKNSTIRSFSGGGVASSFAAVDFLSSLWNNSNAITSVLLETASDFAIGSRFSLYGVK